MNTASTSVLLPAALLATLVLPANLLAFAEVARGSLTLETVGRVSYDTNLLGNASELDDTVFTLSPTLVYRRAAGLGTIDATAGAAINRYLDFHHLDGEDYFASFKLGLPTPEGARETGALSADYSDRTDIDETVGTRVRAKTWGGRFAGTYRAGPRVDLRANLGYTDTTRSTFTDRTSWSAGTGFDYNGFLGGFGLEGDYRYTDTQSTATGTTGAIDQTSSSVSTGLFYKFTSGLRASANVGYRWIQHGAGDTVGNTSSSNGMTFGLRLSGPFLPPSRFPKLQSSFSLGYEKSETIGLNGRGSATVVGNLSLAWQARERTALTVNASRSQGLSTTNLSTVNSNVRFGVTQNIGQRTRLTADLGQTWSDYPNTGRSDRHTRAGLNLTYSVNRHWSAGASYSYTLARSTSDFLDFDRHQFSAFVACTF